MMNKGLSKYKREKILMHFCEDIEASKTARLTGINRNTVNRYYNLFREHILSWQYKEVMRLSGEIEVDESYFGARRVRGKRGRGAAGKTPVFGILKRGGKVWINIFPDKPITAKPAETRMGSGKGNPEFWVAVVKPGRTMFELSFPDEAQAKIALNKAIQKLPIKAKIITREEIV